MTTPVYGLPFPTLTNAPNVPADIQALALAVEASLTTIATPANAASVVSGGKVYMTAGALATGIGATEVLCNIDSGSVVLPANSLFELKVRVAWNAVTTPFNPDFLIRDTNLAGAQLYEACLITTQPAAAPPVGVPYMAEFSVPYKTTAAVTKTFVVSAKRIAGTGTMSVFGSPTNPSSFTITRLGPSSIVTTV